VFFSIIFRCRKKGKEVMQGERTAFVRELLSVDADLIAAISKNNEVKPTA